MTALVKVSTFIALMLTLIVFAAFVRRSVALVAGLVIATFAFSAWYVRYMNEGRGPEGAFVMAASSSLGLTYYRDKAVALLGVTSEPAGLAATISRAAFVWLVDFSWGVLVIVALVSRRAVAMPRRLLWALIDCSALAIAALGVVDVKAVPNFSFIEPIRWLTCFLFVYVVSIPARQDAPAARPGFRIATIAVLAALALVSAVGVGVKTWTDAKGLVTYLEAHPANDDPSLRAVVEAVNAVENKRDWAIYLDESFKGYLMSGAYGKFNCRTTPFLILAATEMFLVNGVFDGCDRYQGIGSYGHSSYGKDAGGRAYEFSCAMARQLSVTHLLRVGFADGKVTLAPLDSAVPAAAGRAGLSFNLASQFSHGTLGGQSSMERVDV